MLPVLSAFDVFVFTCLLPRGCCVLDVEDVVKVSGPFVMLFDVLAAVDAFGALLTAAAVLGFCVLGMKTWIFQKQQESQVSQVPQVVPQHVQLPLREVFPECWEQQGGLGTYLCQDWGSAQHLVQHCLRAKLGGDVGGRGSCSSPFACSV